MYEEHSMDTADDDNSGSDLHRPLCSVDREERRGRRATKQRNFDQLSTKELHELITKELNALMLGRRSDAIPVKWVRKAFGALLVHQISPTALRLQHQIVGYHGRGLIGATEWRKIRPLSESTVHQLMTQLVQHGRAYREMPAYAGLLKQASLGKPVVMNGVALDREVVIDAYFEHYLRLIESIRRSGLLPRDEVARSTADPLVRLPNVEENERDVQIAVSPDGELLQMGTGRHRTAIAQALGLERMPVEIRLIHAEWLSKLVERSGQSPLDALLGWLNAAKQNGLYATLLN
jgi:hypothetical protein